MRAIFVWIWMACAAGVIAQDGGSQYVSIYGGQLHYKVFGHGEPLLIINGGPGKDSGGFETLAQEFAGGGYKAIIFDQRGTGKSNVENKATTTLAIMIEDVERLRKALGYDQWMVFGQSFGGIYAALYATSYPQHIKKLVYSASGGLDMSFATEVSKRLDSLMTPENRTTFKNLTEGFISGTLTPEQIEKRARAMADGYVVDNNAIDKIWSRLAQVDLSLNATIFADLNNIKYDLKNIYNQKITKIIPTLILQGDSDVISTKVAHTMHQCISGSELVILSECGHFGWIDAHDIYFNSIFTFLKS
jgi:proline iminopeptidase